MALKDFLTKNAIKVNVEVKDWEEAVKIGGKLLVESGFAEPQYVEAMIETVKEMGPYIVIAPGIAIPHARPEAGAKAVGLSLITLKNPVNFGNKENDPVKILISFVTTDNKQHLDALRQLAEVLSNSELVSKIKEAKDEEELLKLITQLS